MTEEIGVGPVNFWIPCGVAGIRFTVGGHRGLTEEGAGAGAGTGTAANSETDVAASPTFWTSEGVIQVSVTEEDGMPELASSLSIGNLRRREEDVDWVWERPAARAGLMCLLSAQVGRCRQFKFSQERTLVHQ